MIEKGFTIILVVFLFCFRGCYDQCLDKSGRARTPKWRENVVGPSLRTRRGVLAVKLWVLNHETICTYMYHIKTMGMIYIINI